MENHFQAQKEGYEKEIESLNYKAEHLQHETDHLQKLFREENNMNENIRLEVKRLASENMVAGRL